MVHYYPVSKKELKDLLKISREVFKCSVEKLSEGYIVFIEDAGAAVYIADKIPIMVELKTREKLLAIHLLNRGMCEIPYVTVDQGAVPRILNGADVMAPGIIELSHFPQGALVGVREPQRKAFIAVGRALMSSEEISSVKRGKAIKSLHHVGDKIWEGIIETLIKMQ
jgi:PUA domain protein